MGRKSLYGIPDRGKLQLKMRRYLLVRNLYEILSEQNGNYLLKKPVFLQREEGYSLIGTAGTEVSETTRDGLELGVVCELVYVTERGKK